VTRGLLDAILRDPKRGPDALAFVLAHELGHGACGHCRRGYQLDSLQAELKRGIALGIKADKLRVILETSVAPAGKLVSFLYTREQDYRADLFALHLCRNAGFAPDACLDALRWLSAARHPGLLGGKGDGKDDKPPLLLTYYLSTHPEPGRRLKRLLHELRG